jgi:2-polyprenyl-6-methoxyphenol hydroxylase-like FAD-dependent oxidoreductase
MSITSIAVLGAGVTGLTAAAKFTEMGYRVTLIERRKIGCDIGGGLDIHPNGTKILFSLGIEEKLKSICSGNNREIRIGDPEGRFLNCVPLNKVERNPKYPMLSLFRSDILPILFDNVKDRCTYYEETECIRIDIKDDGVELGFDKIPPIRVDLVIAADGVNSLARKVLFPPSKKRYLGHVALGGKIPRDLYQYNYLHGVRRTCVVFPCTEERAHTLIFCDKPEGWLKANAAFDIHRKAFEGWSREVDTIVSSIDPSSRFCVECFEVPPLESYVFRRVFLAGDAAHGMSPLGALATSLALEDIQELADQFSDRTQTLEQIGKNYDSKRILRAKQFHDFSHQFLIPPITEHTVPLYQARMERFRRSRPDQLFAALTQLTQEHIDVEEVSAPVGAVSEVKE